MGFKRLIPPTAVSDAAVLEDVRDAFPRETLTARVRAASMADTEVIFSAEAYFFTLGWVELAVGKVSIEHRSDGSRLACHIVRPSLLMIRLLILSLPIGGGIVLASAILSGDVMGAVIYGIVLLAFWGSMIAAGVGACRLCRVAVDRAMTAV
jgi:hypothetical protein